MLDDDHNSGGEGVVDERAVVDEVTAELQEEDRNSSRGTRLGFTTSSKWGRH